MEKVLTWILSIMMSGLVVHAEPEYHVVTDIAVTAAHNAEITEYRYSDTHQLREILNYLRRLDTYAPADIAADTFRSDAFRITLYLSDGSQTVYHQIADGYLQKDGGQWLKTDPKFASSLRRLLLRLEAEGPPA